MEYGGVDFMLEISGSHGYVDMQQNFDPHYFVTQDFDGQDLSRHEFHFEESNAVELNVQELDVQEFNGQKFGWQEYGVQELNGQEFNATVLCTPRYDVEVFRYSSDSGVNFPESEKPTHSKLDNLFLGSNGYTEPDGFTPNSLASSFIGGKMGFVPQKCQWSGCDSKGTFKLNSSFKKHMDKHYRPFSCAEQTCRVKDFTNAGDLKRHKEEVHGNHPFKCPSKACKRNKKGFGRKKNLLLHIERTHHSSEDQVTDSPASESGASSRDSNAEEMVSTVDRDDSTDLDTSLRASLMMKLEELKQRKNTEVKKLDVDIAAIMQLLNS